MNPFGSDTVCIGFQLERKALKLRVYDNEARMMSY